MKNDGFFRISFVLFALILVYFPTQAQIETKPIINASLTGTVVDAITKEPISGVTVQLEAVTHQVKTDRDGKFQFVTGQKLPFTLIVSYLGYETQKLVIETSPAVIELKQSVNSLEQVFVTSRRRTELIQ